MGTYEKMIEVVKNWDPFQMEFYETEASDVVNVISVFDDPKYIAKKIQHIYFMSFEEVPALEKCEKLAELLVIKRWKLFIIGCRNFRQPFYIIPLFSGSKTPTSKFSGSKEVRWG